MKKNFSQKIFTWSLVAGLALGILTGIRPAVGAIGSLGSFVPSVPVTVVADYPYAIKEELEDVITRSLARNIESVLQEKVLSVVSLKSGRDFGNGGNGYGAGGASFVQDWRDFSQKAEYRGENVFRGILYDAALGKDSTICKYLSGSLKSAFNLKPTGLLSFLPAKYRTGSLSYFNIENKCTVDPLVKNKFSASFVQGGGWETFLRLLQPQNNITGVLTSSLEELAKQRDAETKADINDAVSGGSFTSKRDCEGKGLDFSCVVLGQVKTPGQILKSTVEKSITEDFSWITSADEFSEILSSVGNALGGALLGKLNNLASGKVNPPNSSTNLSDPNPSVNGNCIQQCVNAFACTGGGPVDITDCVAGFNCQKIADPTERRTCESNASATCSNPVFVSQTQTIVACEENAQRTCQQTCQANNTPF